MTCQPMGIPRQGPPGRIFHTENDITFLYGSGGDGGGGYPDFRVIATDSRDVNERQVIQTKFTGHSVGRWDGDTLVIESIGFTPETWLELFQKAVRPTVYVEFRDRGAQPLHAPAALCGRRVERRLQRGCDSVHIVGIDKVCIDQVLCSSGKFAEHQRAISVGARRHVFQGHEVHSVPERCN
jgi:hypothetical protein